MLLNDLQNKTYNKAKELDDKLQEEADMLEICYKRKKLLSYNEAPLYIKHNSYIVNGYRGILNTQLCMER